RGRGQGARSRRALPNHRTLPVAPSRDLGASVLEPSKWWPSSAENRIRTRTGCEVRRFGDRAPDATCHLSFGTLERSGPRARGGPGRRRRIGGESIQYLARWDGASWSGFQGGTNGPVRAITPFDEGAGPSIFIGGE